MWVFLNDAMLSIVEPGPNPGVPGWQPAEKAKDLLLVRGRVRGDIERVFPGQKVYRTDGRDYLFRALVPRLIVARAMASQVEAISYSNFKGSVAEKDRHDAYAGVWGVMHRFQTAKAGPAKASAGWWYDGFSHWPAPLRAAKAKGRAA